MHKRLALLARCLAAATFALAPLMSQASLVEYSFTGSVSADDADRGYTAFSGTFRFDSAAADAIADTSTGAYAHAGMPWGMSFSLSGGPSLAISTAFHVLVSNDLAGGDQFGLLAQDGTDGISLALHDITGALFSSDALPLPAGGLTLAGFAWTELRWEGADGVLQGRLDTLACTAGCDGQASPVPEPGTLALAAGGISLLRLTRRRGGSGMPRTEQSLDTRSAS